MRRREPVILLALTLVCLAISRIGAAFERRMAYVRF